MITASIVLYRNDAPLLRRAIESILSSPEIAKLVIVDNSPDPALAAANLSDPRLHYVHKPENLGFGRAHNVAFSLCPPDAEYHVIMNPDIYFGPEVVPQLHEYMEQHPDVGMVMPKILFPDGRVQHLCKRLPTPWDLLMRRFLPDRLLHLFEHRMAQYEMRDVGYDHEMRVPCLSGCFMFVRGSVLRELGGFDERFFLYMEDVDLSRRVGQKYHTMFYPKVHVFHAYGKGSYANSQLRNLHIRSALTYFAKWGWLFDRERKQLNDVSHLMPTRMPIATGEPSRHSS